MKLKPLRQRGPLLAITLCLILATAGVVWAAKTSVDQWDTTAGNNTDVGGINVDEGMSPGDVNNAIREMMAQLKTNNSTIIPSGSVQAYVGTTAPSGWLLLNGDTLGSAASTATQKSDDYETLYLLFWNSMADAEAAVDGGRGASAAADWAANKKLTMPDATGRAVFGKEASATRLTAAIAGFSGATLGVTGGDEGAQDHDHDYSGVTTIADTAQGANLSLNLVLAKQTGAASAGSLNAAKMAGDSGNVPPAIVLNVIIKT